MTRASWLIPLAFAAACSSRDQSLGETRPTPHPVVIDPTPTPNPNPNPDPNPNPNPDPNPTPNPNPTPTTPPCEDHSQHARTGTCMPASECRGRVLTSAGYECNGVGACCDDTVGGCPPPNTCGQGGSAMSPGGDGGDGGAPSAVAGGKP